MEIKVCISCKQKKPKTSDYFFYRNKEKGWLSSWCKDCRSLKRDATKDAYENMSKSNKA